MAVLVEAISALVRVTALQQRFPGGWQGFRAAAPNTTLCCDGELARVGFMVPQDVEAFVGSLERHGLVFIAGGTAIDIAVADQQSGLTIRCDWVECGHVAIGENRVAAARLTGSEELTVATPVGWVFRGSLSQTFGFVPGDKLDRSLDFIRAEDSIEAYRSRLTGKLAYVGRTQADRSSPVAATPQNRTQDQ